MKRETSNTAFARENRRSLWVARLRTVGIWVLSLALNLAGFALGFYLRLPAWSFLLFFLPPVLWCDIQAFLAKRMDRNLKQQKVQQQQAYLLAHREEHLEQQKLRILGNIRHASWAVTGLLSLCALGLSLVFQAIVVQLLSTALWFCVLSRILPVPSEESRLLWVSEKEAPRLYELARKAQAASGVKYRLQIILTDEFNMGVRMQGNTCLLQIGPRMLATLSEEEFYAILLHEFSHITQMDRTQKWVLAYGQRISSGYAPWNALFYQYLDQLFYYHFFLYRYTVSLDQETRADKAMAPMAEIAASALLKLSCNEFYAWELPAEVPPYASETPNPHWLHWEIENFQAAMNHRSQDWEAMAPEAISGRSDSHPTFAQRLSTLGLSQGRLLQLDSSPAYVQDREAVISKLEALLFEGIKESYAEVRKARYLDPLEKVSRWEAAGRPVVAEEYSGIEDALEVLGRYPEAEALCDRAIKELPEAASPEAHFCKGHFLLARYDPSGIDHLYTAMERNENYIDRGLELIGSFCCLTGRQAELNTYREKALFLAQEQKDKYDEIEILRKTDDLTAEALPDGMLDSILSYILAEEPQVLRRIYLVRKTITPDFFTSAFLLEFEPKASEEDKSKIWERMFSHLDTCSDWQFSLFDIEDAKFVRKIPGSCVYEK